MSTNFVFKNASPKELLSHPTVTLLPAFPIKFIGDGPSSFLYKNKTRITVHFPSPQNFTHILLNIDQNPTLHPCPSRTFLTIVFPTPLSLTPRKPGHVSGRPRLPLPPPRGNNGVVDSVEYLLPRVRIGWRCIFYSLTVWNGPPLIIVGGGVTVEERLTFASHRGPCNNAVIFTMNNRSRNI